MAPLVVFSCHVVVLIFPVTKYWNYVHFIQYNWFMTVLVSLSPYAALEFVEAQ